MYSIQAGFVEPGENLEQAVEREILEEVGIRIEGITYFGSQPWPFPNSLMIGFTARYAGGELTIDKTEIEEAAWYTVDALPPIPPPLSIARKLIDQFVEKQRKKADL
jgi:NAD+ diphosphatase